MHAGLDPALQVRLQSTQQLLAQLRSGEALATPDHVAPPSPPPSPPMRARAPEALPPPAAPAAEPLQITLQCGRGRHILVTVAPGDCLSTAFKAFEEEAVKKGWLASAAHAAGLRFVFDGEPLLGATTVAEAGLEEDDVVDVEGL